MELGLLRPLAENPALWYAIPPDIATSELVRPIERAVLVRQHAIAAIHEAVSQVEDVYREEHRKSATPLRLLHGSDVIRSALLQARDICVEEMLTAQPGGSRDPEALVRTLPQEIAMSRRGVKQRTLYQHTVRAHGPTLAYIEQVTAAGAEVRTLNELFDRLIVFDRRAAFIPDHRHDLNGTALLIEHPAVVQYLVKVFDHAWARAEPVSMTPEQVRPRLMTDETRRTVLRLMVEGHTDAVIGTRIGISTRTVSTHIRKASELLGGRSRAHLAYLLAQSELLEETPGHS
ncbi:MULTISPECIES: LuxR C-terminal-related transcriptional regulator [unclassified Streptomyces]|uniref:LuxR C-terminal-related transcriptional regulator n=1 Tax=unclassified Streptomyces TaxID=2593676 RepID=UPI001BEAA31C|nr:MULTISPECIES: LuxR C-terminal-related transcriptional regulator [unclassified Streptomyces]MBT2405521.1 LuxR family transcriptional regulator [Streptomyces sp. ISL-21]MBT2454440.1 LuxR family transcriptional regulator [Streptomyces sp. ISL-86]MBT2607800.1 LuxR family transcriptional regulator [Streptomyces sp. ISL-87]